MLSACPLVSKPKAMPQAMVSKQTLVVQHCRCVNAADHTLAGSASKALHCMLALQAQPTALHCCCIPTMAITWLVFDCREHPLESLTRLYADLMRGADLTPSDEVVALLLLAAHQRNMRKRHMKRKLAGRDCCTGLPEDRKCHDASSSAEDSSHTDSSAAKTQDCLQPRTGQSDSAGSASEQRSNLAKQEAGNCHGAGESRHKNDCQNGDSSDKTVSNGNSSTSSSMTEAAVANGGAVHQQGASQDHKDLNQNPQQQHQQPQQQQQHQQRQNQCQPDHQQYGQQQQQQSSHMRRNQRPTLKEMHVTSGVDVEQGWDRGDDVADDLDDEATDEELGQVTVYEHGRGCGFPCVLTPSSLASELAPDMPHSQVAEICLGELRRLPASLSAPGWWSC